MKLVLLGRTKIVRTLQILKSSELQTSLKSRTYLVKIKIRIEPPVKIAQTTEKCLEKIRSNIDWQCLSKLNFKPPKPYFKPDTTKPNSISNPNTFSFWPNPTTDNLHGNSKGKFFCQIVNSQLTIGNSIWLKRRTSFHFEFIFVCVCLIKAVLT